MSDAVFPVLAGLTWELTLSPTFPGNISQASATGSEARIALDPRPLYKFELVYEFLRDSPGQRNVGNPQARTELEQLLGFYLARGGDFDSFLLDPGLLTGKPNSGKVQGIQIGVGDGATTDFQLLWRYGGFVDWVQSPRGQPRLYNNGEPVAGWALQPLGIVRFAVAPAAGAIITADCAWWWRVRFAESSIDFKAFLFDFWECQSVKLQQVRDE